MYQTVNILLLNKLYFTHVDIESAIVERFGRRRTQYVI